MINYKNQKPIPQPPGGTALESYKRSPPGTTRLDYNTFGNLQGHKLGKSTLELSFGILSVILHWTSTKGYLTITSSVCKDAKPLPKKCSLRDFNDE